MAQVGGAAQLTSPGLAPAALLEGIDGFLIDLDGVVYLGDQPIPGSAQAIAELRRRGKRLVYLTNDPVGSRAEYVERLRSCGVDADARDIVTSGRATAEFIRSESPVVGTALDPIFESLTSRD